MTERKETGDRGEEAVAVWLERRGCTVLERQWRCRWGELDLVARTPEGVLCFVEVKTRAVRGFARAREAVTGRKRERLRMAARCYLARKRHSEEDQCRFDVAEVYPGERGFATPQICYIEDAFR